MAAAVYRTATMTSPNRNRTTNRTVGHTRSTIGGTLPLIINPPKAVAAMTRIYIGAATGLLVTFPVGNTLEEMLASRISAMRVCFSSTIELVMPIPKTMTAVVHTIPKPIPRR